MQLHGAADQTTDNLTWAALFGSSPHAHCVGVVKHGQVQRNTTAVCYAETASGRAGSRAQNRIIQNAVRPALSTRLIDASFSLLSSPRSA